MGEYDVHHVFSPYFAVQRQGVVGLLDGDTVILPGDLLHCDFTAEGDPLCGLSAFKYDSNEDEERCGKGRWSLGTVGWRAVGWRAVRWVAVESGSGGV